MELKRIVREKYLDTDIDSLVFHFGDTKTESLISEFDVPDGLKYMVFFSQKNTSDIPAWIEVVNPSAVIKLEHPVLPDIGNIEFEGKQMSLQELIKKVV